MCLGIESQNKHQNTIVMCCMASVCIYTLTTLLVTGALLFFYSNAESNFLLDTSSAVSYLAVAVSKPPIVDIQRVASPANCAPGFEPHPVGKWAGTSSGCYCSNGEFKTGSSSKECRYCSTIPTMEPITINFWDNMGFCVKRNSAVKYMDNCPENMKQCADKYTCVPIAEDCPINTITVVKSNPTIAALRRRRREPITSNNTSNSSANTMNNTSNATSSNSTSNNTNSGSTTAMKSVPFDGNLALAFGHTAQGNLKVPLYKLQAMTSGTPCVTPSRVPGRTSNYPMLSGTFFCGKYGPDNVTATYLDSQTERHWYENNGLYKHFVSELPAYAPTVENEFVGFYARSTVKMTNAACASLDWNNLNDISVDLSAMNSTMSLLNIIAFVTLILIAISMCRLIEICMCGCFIWDLRHYNPICLMCLIPFLACFSLVFTYIYGGIAVSYEKQYEIRATSLATYSAFQCFEPNTPWTNVYKDFTDPHNIDSYRKCFSWPQYLLVLSSFLLVSMIATACCLPKDNWSRDFFMSTLTKGQYGGDGYNPYNQQIDMPMQQMNNGVNQQNGMTNQYGGAMKGETYNYQQPGQTGNNQLQYPNQQQNYNYT